MGAAGERAALVTPMARTSPAFTSGSAYKVTFGTAISGVKEFNPAGGEPKFVDAEKCERAANIFERELLVFYFGEVSAAFKEVVGSTWRKAAALGYFVYSIWRGVDAKNLCRSSNDCSDLIFTIMCEVVHAARKA